MLYGIRFRLGVLLAAFGVLATGLTGLYSYTESRTLLVRAAERDLMTATQGFLHASLLRDDRRAELTDALIAAARRSTVLLAAKRDIRSTPGFAGRAAAGESAGGSFSGVDAVVVAPGR